ncbi:SusD/RagB family nutrient-binding outer membrane lipoprotein [Millionella massiliensis]|uniref:SusD/RagB family nutrient-binding outer membrane lipoprotein n=1 Tax=Millionella massiliensis TaxID=1871023 RepID=UPI0008D92A0F|nr:SusD/RagB family nutrient-binding outer membrane lipoprotein [Millionella massiliensis]
MKLTKYILGGLAALALVGCKDKMRELNTNPDTIGNTNPEYMFLSAMSNLDFDSRGAGQVRWSSGVNMQYFVYYDGAGDGTYCNDQAMNWSSLPMIGYYYDWYKSKGYSMVSIMNYLDDNLDEAAAQKYQDLRAICGIVKVYEAFRVFQNYGANVYTQAFKAITEGITLPEYDIFDNAMYEALDDELAGYIAVLEQQNSGQCDLGVYDPIYGYKLPDGAAQAAMAHMSRGNYDEQRTLWKKFANTYRLYMAWIMKNADPARFDKVLAETSASGRFESASDGAYTYLNGPSNGTNSSGTYAAAENADISTLYSVSDNFVWYLKQLNDPRLPLLARANNLYEANTALEWIKKYYPDSLEQHMVYNEDTKTWGLQSWNGVFDFWGDPMLAYQGQSPNPYDADKTNAGKFWGKSTFTFTFYAPGYIKGDEEHNKTLFPWTVTNPNDPTDTYTIETRADTSFSIEIGSRPQGRYFLSAGGQYGPYDGQGRNGFDGTDADRYSLYFRRPLYTYPEYCFMMAYLSLDGVNTGKSADEWYNTAVTSAMEELQNTAITSNIQVATNLEHTHEDETYGLQYINPEIVGINDNGVYSITDKIGSYVTSVALSNFSDQKAAVVGQMWIYSYLDPVKMWDWWRVTGYPKIVEVETPADRPTDRLPYWVAPHANADYETVLEFPRRSALPQPEAANNANYNAARDELMKQANYGTTYNDNSGRIYWDTQGL